MINSFLSSNSHFLCKKSKSSSSIAIFTIMKNSPKDQDHLYFSWTFSKLMAFFFLLISLSYFIYSLRFVNHSYDCNTQIQIQNQETHLSIENLSISPFEETLNPKFPKETNISHIIFSIVASLNLWKKRKEYIKLCRKSKVMRGIVWLDKSVETDSSNKKLLPPLKIFEDTSKFKYKNPKGHWSAIRISRIVSETLRLKMKNVRWFVMGDDNTFFITENLVKILQKYNHN